MKNLHFAIICSYNCVKHLNELEELTEEQRDLLFDFERMHELKLPKMICRSSILRSIIHHYNKPLKKKCWKYYKIINWLLRIAVVMVIWYTQFMKICEQNNMQCRPCYRWWGRQFWNVCQIFYYQPG